MRECGHPALPGHPVTAETHRGRGPLPQEWLFRLRPAKPASHRRHRSWRGAGATPRLWEGASARDVLGRVGAEPGHPPKFVPPRIGQGLNDLLPWNLLAFRRNNQPGPGMAQRPRLWEGGFAARSPSRELRSQARSWRTALQTVIAASSRDPVSFSFPVARRSRPPIGGIGVGAELEQRPGCGRAHQRAMPWGGSSSRLQAASDRRWSAVRPIRQRRPRWCRPLHRACPVPAPGRNRLAVRARIAPTYPGRGPGVPPYRR